ncbi:TPA: hypothetical protein NJY97_004717 [Vibrio parahaemolyticus]|nr:hypothetical protein [Vibrio parahaemolyticus]HCE1609511.1 hypothetical protein [Vibrio parahaemolyticus]HCE5232451.1 hypothetical protein [Vibrio parahaemolyticus]HCG5110951.1 hypothetical protein [Vibrio parahaemolyticus]HCG5121387.1 hypothetical protein [Vibrio parahaemolyticus]
MDKLDIIREGIEEDFNHLIVLSEMVGEVYSHGRANDTYTVGYQVCLNAMLTEIVMIIGRLMDTNIKSKSIPTLIGLLIKRMKDKECEKLEEIIKFQESQLEHLRADKIIESLRFLRNKRLAHNDMKNFEINQDVQALLDACNNIRCYLDSISYYLDVPFKYSAEDFTFWHNV